MRAKVLTLLLTLVIAILSACGAAPTQAVDLPRTGQQTVAATVVVTESPTPDKIPENTKTPQGSIENPEFSAVLKIFPLITGTSWSYTGENYAQAAGDPNTLIKASTYIADRVIDTQSQPPYHIAHIQRNTTLVSSDPAWQDFGSLRLGEYDFWYVILDERVYLSTEIPDPANLQVDQLILELEFPLSVGMSWCPSTTQNGSPTPVAETPVPCAFAGARNVLAEKPYTTQAGNYASCYELSDFYNSGSPIKVFCEGVGIVAEKYDHFGARFGYSKELVKLNITQDP